MPLRIVLLTPARRFIANRFGLGYQLPLGLVLIGGPLVDAGHTVLLVDNDAYGWGHDRLVAELTHFAPDCVLQTSIEDRQAGVQRAQPIRDGAKAAML